MLLSFKYCASCYHLSEYRVTFRNTWTSTVKGYNPEKDMPAFSDTRWLTWFCQQMATKRDELCTAGLKMSSSGHRLSSSKLPKVRMSFWQQINPFKAGLMVSVKASTRFPDRLKSDNVNWHSVGAIAFQAELDKTAYSTHLILSKKVVASQLKAEASNTPDIAWFFHWVICIFA